MTDTTLLRDVITIPERAGAEDYVLRLTEGVGEGRIDATIREYVVTDDLARRFDQALDLVASAIKSNESRGAFLSGSYGSGKSHFMAVLYALLGGNPTARSQDKLAPVITAHDPALQGKNVLRLAYHFLGFESMEQCILGGYVERIRALHPDAPLPAVHKSDALIADAERRRDDMGDDAFLAGLNRDAQSGATASPWTRVLGEQAWTAESYDAARLSPPESPERQRLVSALVKAYFSSFTVGAEFVDLDTGLAVISSHAKALGYDAVIMFLDELVLWLAFRVGDSEFFGREAQKVTKLVEFNTARSIPLVSFVARQLDLRKYFVDSGSGIGSEQDALDQAFRHQEGRFATIVLGDDNLPFVAEKRLLAPNSAEAKAEIDDAFARLDRTPAVWDVLLDGVGTAPGHRGADQAAFRRTYPFSPALVSTLTSLASAMQRDRTALKVMQQLLVNQRDYLTISHVVPVGDVFDLVVQGNQAITPEMQGRFRNAKDLYDNKLRPMLLREHSLTGEDAAVLPPDHAFRADDRLVKTLVLSAIAPEVPALKELTAGRLASLNHGSIVSPLPGGESTIVLSKLKRWSAEVPEIHLTADPLSPVVRLRISEVDYESVVQKARGEDNEGRRRETLKSLVWEAFGFSDADTDVLGISRQSRVWRGSRREIEVLWGNVRDTTWLADEAFKATAETWRFVIDYPFDEQGKSVREDDQRIEDMNQRSVVSNTVVWLPHFLFPERRTDLGRLCILDWLLTGNGDRWQSMSADLSVTDRPQAKSILENQRSMLRQRLKDVIQEAYGVATPKLGSLDIDEGHDRVLRSLNPEFSPQAPVGPDMAGAFTNLVDQVFTTSFPGHPKFEPGDVEVKTADLQRVLDKVEEARQQPEGRIFIEPRDRDVLARVANALGVGHMGENHFIFSSAQFGWGMKLARAMGAANVDATDPVQVGVLRGWVKAEQPTQGLRPEVADLVIAAWGVQEGRAWYRFGQPLVPRPSLGRFPDDAELRPEPLPSADDWRTAVTRTAKLFGIVNTDFLTGQAVAELDAAVREKLTTLSAPVRALPIELASACQRLGVADSQCGRCQTATAVARLVADLSAQPSKVALVEAVAHASLPGTDEAAARSLTTAETVAGQVKSFPWERLKPLLVAEKQSDQRGKDAKAAVDRLRVALDKDELALSLGTALSQAENDTFTWLAAGVAAPPPPPAPLPPPLTPPASTRKQRIVRSRPDMTELENDVLKLWMESGGRGVVVEWWAEE